MGSSPHNPQGQQRFYCPAIKDSLVFKSKQSEEDFLTRQLMIRTRKWEYGNEEVADKIAQNRRAAGEEEGRGQDACQVINFHFSFSVGLLRWCNGKEAEN